MDMNVTLGREEFRRWARSQPRGRYERVNGRVVRMPAEQVVHVEIKMAIWRALADAIRAAGVEARAFGDGLTIEVGEDVHYLVVSRRRRRVTHHRRGGDKIVSEIVTTGQIMLDALGIAVEIDAIYRDSEL
jgi:Uma2 family endonuclease